MKPSLNFALAKAHLRVEHNFDDPLIVAMSAAAVDAVLDRIGLAGELEDQVHEWCGRDGLRTMVPIIRVVKVEKKTGTEWDELTGSDWALFGNVDKGYRLETNTGNGTYRATIEHGFPEFPATLEMAALFLLAHYYENRGAVVVGAGVAAMELPLGVKALTDPWRRILFA